jgi:hypothetical protein
MAKTDRSLIVAGIFGLSLICFSVGLMFGGDWTSRSYEETGKPAASAEAYAVKNRADKFAAYPIVESNRCYSAKHHDTADLCAQWRAAIAAEKAADAAKWSNRLSIVGAILSAIGLAFLLRSLRQTETSLAEARTANEIARRSARPYLTFVRGRFKAFVQNGMINTRVKVVVENGGTTPARLTGWAMYEWLSPLTEPWAEQQMIVGQLTEQDEFIGSGRTYTFKGGHGFSARFHDSGSISVALRLRYADESHLWDEVIWLIANWNEETDTGKFRQSRVEQRLLPHVTCEFYA